MRVRRIETGAQAERYRLYSVCSARGDSELEEFLIKHAGEAVAILRCLSDAAESGPHSLGTSRCHYIDQQNKIYELIGGRLRVAFFTDSDRIVICTHGFPKSTQGTPSQEKKTAARTRKAYFEAKESGSLLFEEPEEEN